jgi:hypothetical protein
VFACRATEPGDREPNSTHGLLIGPTARSGDSGDGHAYVCCERASDTRRHLYRDGLRNSSVPHQHVLRNLEQGLLDGVLVCDDAADEDF